MRLAWALIAISTLLSGASAAAAAARQPAVLAEPCQTGLTLTVHPGVYGRTGKSGPPVARDIPRGEFTVSMPLYPDSKRLSTFVGSPVPGFPTDPYLQTAVAEYQARAGEATVMQWYGPAFASCGWRAVGFGFTDASVLRRVIDYAANPNLQVEMSFGKAPGGGTFIAYDVQDTTYPRRPARSFLRGPFARVRVAAGYTPHVAGRRPHTIHVVVADRRTISALVTAVNKAADYHTAPIECIGAGLRTIGPAWLSFVRPNGTAVHAYEQGPGKCFGLAVNGVRWLVDRGQAWQLIEKIVRMSGGRG